jgi:hypothetical protein
LRTLPEGSRAGLASTVVITQELDAPAEPIEGRLEFVVLQIYQVVDLILTDQTFTQQGQIGQLRLDGDNFRTAPDIADDLVGQCIVWLTDD